MCLLLSMLNKIKLNNIFVLHLFQNSLINIKLKIIYLKF